MGDRWKRDVEAWRAAGLLDDATVERIETYQANEARSRGTPWPTLVAVALGALSLAAGVLLFVAANWDALSPGGRYALVLLMIAALHGGGAAAASSLPSLSTALHAAGTVSLGGGIYLSAQVFHLQEHWPLGLGLWGVGALVAWGLLRQTPQALFAAVLLPAWLVAERLVLIERRADLAAAQGLCLLALVYLFARIPRESNPARRALFVLGGVALFPSVYHLFTALAPPPFWLAATSARSETGELVVHGLAYVLPLGLAVGLRRSKAWGFLPAAGCVGLLAALDIERPYQHLAALLLTFGAACALAFCGARERSRAIELLGLGGAVAAQLGVLLWASDHQDVWVYAVCVLLAAGVAWGGVQLTKKHAVNTAIVLFGLTVAFFYFSTVMDKLGRSLSLIGLGLLLLGGGFALERARRHLLAAMPGGRS